MGQDFALEIGFDAFFQRHGFGVAQFGVGFGIAFGIAADFGSFVAFAKGGELGFQFRRGKANRDRRGFAQMQKECVPAFEKLFAQRSQKGANLFLPPLTRRDFLLADGGGFLFAIGQTSEAAFVFQPGDAFGGGLEVQPQWALDGDLALAEIFVVEDFAGYALALNGLMRDRVLFSEAACFAVVEVAKDLVISPVRPGSFALSEFVCCFLLKVGGRIWRRRSESNR